MFELLFYGTLGNWKTDPLDFGLKNDAKPICSRLYPLPKVDKEILKIKLDI